MKRIGFLLLSVLFAASVFSGCRGKSKSPDVGPSAKRQAAREAEAKRTPEEAEKLITRIRNEIAGQSFLRPSRVTFAWYDDKGAQTAASGWETAAGFKPESDYTAMNRHTKAITQFLEREGFARDENNSTEISDSYQSGNLVAQVRSICQADGVDCVLSVRAGILGR